MTLPRAAVPAVMLDTIEARNPGALDLLVLEDGVDLQTVDFLVPSAMDPVLRKQLRQVLPRLERLQVIQVPSAGTDWVEPLLPPQATLCNARGARDAPVAEWILGALLGASTGLLEFSRLTAWSKDRSLQDLSSWTVVVIGMGSIGRELERYLHPLGTKVVGVASRARDDLHGPEEFPGLLPDADAVVLLAPLSDATRGLVGSQELALLPDGALVINAARGPVLDPDAILAETLSGRLRAVLDVTDPEPLPDGHPLWTAPGVLAISPHMAGNSSAGHEGAAQLAAEQLERWLKGEPLINVVRRGAGEPRSGGAG